MNIGRNIDWRNVSMEQKWEKSDELRDILCTLRWEIWQRAGISKRVDMPENYGEIYLKSFETQLTSDYTIEDIERTRYHAE